MENGLIDPELAIGGLEDPQGHSWYEDGPELCPYFSLLCLMWLLEVEKLYTSHFCDFHCISFVCQGRISVKQEKVE